jgi:hypothetical protein
MILSTDIIESSGIIYGTFCMESSVEASSFNLLAAHLPDVIKVPVRHLALLGGLRLLVFHHLRRMGPYRGTGTVMQKVGIERATLGRATSMCSWNLEPSLLSLRHG